MPNNIALRLLWNEKKITEDDFQVLPGAEHVLPDAATPHDWNLLLICAPENS
ncbi:MAG: hypothetical protein P8L79_15465 [Rhodospirillaceae bacterium]|nr:hypothetical protein [Rhodospirillaceae bacterium]